MARRGGPASTGFLALPAITIIGIAAGIAAGAALVGFVVAYLFARSVGASSNAATGDTEPLRDEPGPIGREISSPYESLKGPQPSFITDAETNPSRYDNLIIPRLNSTRKPAAYESNIGNYQRNSSSYSSSQYAKEPGVYESGGYSTTQYNDTGYSTRGPAAYEDQYGSARFGNSNAGRQPAGYESNFNMASSRNAREPAGYDRRDSYDSLSTSNYNRNPAPYGTNVNRGNPSFPELAAPKPVRGGNISTPMKLEMVEYNGRRY